MLFYHPVNYSSHLTDTILQKQQLQFPEQRGSQVGQPWDWVPVPALGPHCPSWEGAGHHLQIPLCFSSPAVLSPQVGLFGVWEGLVCHGLRFPFVSEALSPFAP